MTCILYELRPDNLAIFYMAFLSAHEERRARTKLNCPEGAVWGQTLGVETCCFLPLVKKRSQSLKTQKSNGLGAYGPPVESDITKCPAYPRLF